MGGGKLLGRLLTSSALWRVDAVMVPDGVGTSGAPRPLQFSRMVALEPRVLFDAALADTLEHVSGGPDTGDAQPQDNGHEALVAALLGDGPTEEVAPEVEVAFVDPSVRDSAQIIAAFGPGVEVHLLSAGSDGVAQMAAVLAGRSNVSAVHIISHGSPGTLSLGSADLTAESIRTGHADDLAIISAALTGDADILIYGCNFASGLAGQEAVALLASSTGADVAASTDATGAASLGGDWDLESVAGAIDSEIVSAPDWDGSLTKLVINSPGGTLADGSDGMRIHVMSNGQYQISYHGANQLYNPPTVDDDTVLFNGIYMAVGSTVVGPATNSNNGAAYSGPANGPGIASTDATFREAGQSLTGTGTKADPFRVTTTLYYDANNNGSYNAATDYQLVVVTEYSVPDGYMTLRMTVTPPPTNAQVVKVYHTLDTFLAGGDEGPAFSLPQNLAQTNNTTGNPSLVAVRKDPGGPNDSFVGFAEAQGGREFDHWYSATYNGNNLYTSGLNNGGNIVNTWDTNATTDNGLGVQFTLGAVNTVQTWSYHLAFSSEASIDLDSNDSSGVTGSAYLTTYTTGSGATIPVADIDAHIANVTGDIAQVRATLSNVQAGDSLTVNLGALPPGIVVVSQTASQIILGASPSPQTEATFDLALQALGFTTTSSSISARTVSFAVTNELGIEGFASASTIGINQPPNAQNDAFTVAEDGTLNGNLFANNGNGADVDPEADPFTITAINGAPFTVGVPVTLANGVLTVTNATTGTFTFVPNANYNGPASFSYTITDPEGGTDTATASITVSPVNDPPIIDLDGPLPVSDGTLPPSPPDNAWQVALYGGHFGVAGSIDPNSTAETGGAGTPTLHGVGYVPQGSISFNDPDITNVENPRDSLMASGFSYTANPVNGDYVPGNGIWTMVMSRTLTADATITVGAPGQYFDDHAELYINGTRVDAIIGWYPSLPAGEVISYAASAGDVVEVRLTNVGGLGGFNVSLTTPEQPNDLDHAATFTEGDAPVPVTLQSKADASDVEDSITSLVISAGGGSDGTAEHVTIAGQAFDLATSATQTATVGGTTVSISYNAGTQAFTITNSAGSATPMPQADLDALLRDITYENTSQDPTAGDRTLTFVATDSGGATSAPAVSTITVVPVNDPPVAADDTLSVPEDGTLSTNILTANGIDSDPEGDALSVVSATIDTDGDGDQDSLVLGTATPIIVAGNTIGTLTLTAAGQLSFAPAANYNGPVPALTYTVSDGVLTDTATAAITVTAANDPPVIDLDGDDSSAATGADHVTTYVENAPGVNIPDTADFVLNDVDNAISEIVVTLTDGRIGDTINFPSVLPGGISAAVSPVATLTAPGTMTLTLTGTGATTLADWQSVLSSITFLPSTNDVHNPDPADRHITVQAWDASNAASNLATATIHVTPQNDPPTLDLDDDNSTGNSGNAYLNYTENGAPVALHSNIVTTDLDDANYESATVSHTNPQAGDQIFVNGVLVAAGDSGSVGGIPYTVSTNGSGHLVVSFAGSASTASYDAALQSVSFANSSENPATVQRDITFQLNDGTDNSPLRHAYVTVAAVNDPPVGTPIAQQSGQDSTALTPLDASTSFSDPDSSTLTYSLAPGAPAWLSINPVTGVITGTPPSDASTTTNGSTPGIWDVTVIASDGGTPNLSDGVTFTYAISNPPPVAQDDALAASEGTTLTGQNVFANNSNGADHDPDGDSFTVSAVGGAGLSVGAATPGSTGGLFTIGSNGAFTFTDNGDFEDLGVGETRNTSITYEITDSDGGTATATVTVTVTGTNDDPTVSAPLSDMTGDDADVVVGVNASAAFADADVTDTLTYSATGLPAGLSIDPNTGIISGTIDPSASQNGNTGLPTAGVYTVVVTADDGNGGIVSDTFTYTISNPPPVAEDDDLTGDEDTLVTGENVLADNGNGPDSDPDGDTLEINAVSGLAGNVGIPVAGSAGGLFTLGSTGDLTFDPNGDFDDLAVGESRDTTITYQVSDTEGGVSTATVTYTVTGVNDAPVPLDPDDPGTPPSDPNAYIPVQPGTDSGVATPLDVTDYASDPDGSDTLTFTINPAELPPGLSFDGTTITGTYAANASQGGPANDGIYPVTLTVSDGHGGSFTTTILFDVGNPPPVAQPDDVTASEDNVLNGNVFADNGNGADSDPDNDAFTVTAVGGSAPAVGTAVPGTGGGTFTINSNGTYSFDPGTDFNGLDFGETGTSSITYTITDADGATSTATVTVTIEGANDAPVPVDPGNPGPDPENPIPADGNTIVPVQSADDGEVFTALSPLVDLGPFIVDPDGEAVTFSTSSPLPAGLALNPDGTVTGTIAPNASQGGDDPLGNPGVYTITVNVSDGTTTTPLTLVIDVSNPPPVAVNDTASVGEDSPDVTGNVITDPVTGDADTAPDSDPLEVVSAVQGVNPITIGTPFTTSGGGVLTLNDDGSYTFEPGTAYNGLDVGETAVETISYTVSDGNGGFNTAVLAITVSGANDAPVPVDPGNPGPDPENPIPADGDTIVPLQTADDGEVFTALSPLVDLGPYIVDPDGEAVIFSTSSPLPAGLTLNPDGTVTGTIAPNASQGGDDPLGNPGVYTITVNVSDGTSTTPLTLTIDVSNPPPVAQDDVASVGEDSPDVTGNVLTGAGADTDTAPDSDPLTVTAAVQGVTPITIGTAFTTSGGGILTLNDDGSYTFEPGTAYNGLDVGETATETITYTVDDGNGGQDMATLVITVQGANDTPVVIDPSDPGTPANPNPAADPLNIIPDVATTDGATPAPVNVGSYIVDPDGEPLTFTAVGLPPGMTIDPNTGVISGTLPPDASQTGPYTVTVTATDPDGAFVETTVTYTVTNLPPVAQDDTATVGEDAPDVTGNVITGAGADSDTAPDTDPLEVVSAVQGVTPITIGTPFTTAGGGVLTLLSTGSYTFAPGTAYNGLDVGETATETITYTVDDGNGGQDMATLVITIQGANDTPVVIDPSDPGTPANPNPAPDPLNIIPDVATTDGATPAPVNVGSYIVDPDGEPLTFTAVGLPPGMTIDPNTGIISGTLPPDASQSGPYTVTITATDPDGAFIETTVTYTVTNLPPVAQDDVASVGEDAPDVTGNVITGAGADSDTAPDSDPLTVTAAVQGVTPITIGTAFTTSGGGILTLNDDGSYTFEPGTAYNGLDVGETATETITYTVDDGNGGQDMATLVITIQGANDTPVVIDPSDPGTPTNPNPAPDPLNIIPDVATTDGATPAPVNVGSYIVDPDGEPLTFTATGLPPGMVIDPATGIISGTLPPDASQTGPYTVTITATDPDGATVQTTVTYTVSNLPPVAVDDQSTGNEDGPQSGNVLTDPATGDADTGPDSDPLTVTNINGSPVTPATPATLSLTYGTLVMQADGTWSFTPNAAANALAVGETATETLTYTVDDGNGGTDTATLEVEITGVNDAPVTTGPAPDQEHDEGETVNLPFGPFFTDADTSDDLTFTATGLPPGLAIDPDTGEISGTIALGSSANGPYLVTVTADDGHGGTVSLTFEWEVVLPAMPMPQPQRGPVPLPPLLAGGAGVAEHVIMQTVNDLGSLAGTPDLGEHAVLTAVAGLSSLNAATDIDGRGDVISRLVAWAGRQGRSAGWMFSVLDDLAREPYAGDNIALALTMAGKDVLGVRTLLRDGALFIGIDDLGSGVTVAGVTGAGGHALPDHVAVIDAQTLVVNVRPDLTPLEIVVRARDSAGRTHNWQLSVDPVSGEVAPAGPAGDKIATVIEDMRSRIAQVVRDEGPPVSTGLAAE